MIARRLWPALVLVLFCLPMFIGLGNEQLWGDEAGHSFSVDRILEIGDWLIPKSSPYPDGPFLEKPPLKFWLVAAGIKAGLPWDEFGLRFWDPLFGSIAFLYVFALGRRLAGPLCGAAAVLILFVHGPFMMVHGLRSNDMEAALTLAYCGGMYHYLRWADSDDNVKARWRHALTVTLFFALGFMVKFVAAGFLPIVLGAASLAVPSFRTRVFRDWRIWLTASAVAVAVIAPWFIYCTVVFGKEFWSIIFGAHVYTRLTSYLDPAHVHRWNFYFTELAVNLSASRTLWLVIAGALLLVAETIRQRRTDGLLIILWYALPLSIISLASSKLYHYEYPYLPPVALAGGFAIGFLWNTIRPVVESAVAPLGRLSQRPPGGVLSVLFHPVTRSIFLGVALIGFIVTVWTMVNGAVVVRYGDTILLKNSMVIRPALIAAALVLLGGRPELLGRFGIPVLMLAVLPADGYRTTLHAFSEGRPEMRIVRDCLLRVGARPELMTEGPRGIYVNGNGSPKAFETPFRHEYTYYFRRVLPWHRPRETPPDLLRRYLFDKAQERPVLIETSKYEPLIKGFRDEMGADAPPAPAVVHFEADIMIALPGPYSACAAELYDHRR